MLEKHLYDSWKSRMELYMMNRPHGRMILASVEKGPLVWPSITEDGVTRLKEYVELTPAPLKPIKQIVTSKHKLHSPRLPHGKSYALVSQHRMAKDLWEKIKLLMQGTSLTKQEREGHIAKQCTKPKRKRDETWFNDKVLLVQAQASGQSLTEEEIAFLADPGLPDIQTSHIVNTHNAAYHKPMTGMPNDSDCDELTHQDLLSWRISLGMGSRFTFT
ncbi:hypothetical protein Tco_1163963 [Tanacetum coccineum]